MKGFGAFRDLTRIDLADVDLVALVGPTGSGKSTIIDAITFALYGTVARYDDNRLVAPAINQTSNEARVSVDFELNGQVYTAVRIVRRTTSGGATTREARLEQGPAVLAADARTMSREVEALLRLDVDQFNRTVVLPQGKFAAFLHDKPGDRQNTLVQLLGVELYRRIGKAARSRKAAANNQVDALRSEHDRVAKDLTDERQAELDNRITKLNAAHCRFLLDRESIATFEGELTALGDRIKTLNRRIDRLEQVTVPTGLSEFAHELSEAINAESDASRLRSEQRAIRELASHSFKAGPDKLAVQRELDEHRDLANKTQAIEVVSREVEEANAHHETVHCIASDLRARQEKLDRCVDESRRAELRARDASDGEVSLIQIDDWARLHDRHKDAADKAVATAEAALKAKAAIPALSKELKHAETAETATSARVEELRRHAGVLGHVDLLEVGEDCPLCLQRVHKLPAHALDEGELRRAKEEYGLTKAALHDAKQGYEDAKRQLIKADAEAASAQETAQSYECDIASIPSHDRLESLRVKATRLANAVRLAGKAKEKAEIAAQEHRESQTYTKALNVEQQAETRVTQLKASKDTLEDQLTSLRKNVAALPSKEELQAHLAEASRLHKELEQAECRLDTARIRYEEAASQLRELNKRRTEAIMLLQRSRDQVAAYEPPDLDTSDLVSAWTTLNDWAQVQAQDAGTERQTASEQQSSIEKRRSTVLQELRTLCEDALGHIDPDTPVEDLGFQLVEHRTEAKRDLEHFNQRRDDLRELETRIGDLKEQAQVADKLGSLLRADGFESWLMETALHRLVEQATKRLYVLSSGQYSLEVHERDFFVRDHSNAEELRRARTLSGGETFLASLSLALALADTTAEISTGDVPAMESIFLDEGFGTLDPHTLDTVASAVEELGATGRLVGIVTHIRELADRMPVRLEVTKAGGSATVERVDV